jgi:S-adenosylmethionine:tRNA ribosyltransferase-isomerase
MRIADFDFELPERLIAQYPLPGRSDSRLLALEGAGAEPRDRRFRDFPELLRPGDLLVLNDTRVMRARLYGHKETGGRVEILIERLLDAHTALAHVRAGKAPRPGARLLLEDGTALRVLGRVDDLYRLEADLGLGELMERHGHMPIPPYVAREDEPLDETRYQTIYARRDGAVAAPTAGLHFDAAMLERIRAMGVELAQVTLHVGAGTFKPVRAKRRGDHVMRSEWLEVDERACRQVCDAQARGGRVVAVGTTSVRSLESAAAGGTLAPFTGETRLFIRPGYRFQVVDALITNFHLPRSTLLMLVCAFGGCAAVMRAYRHAVGEGYRFFSYGDAMFLTRRDAA